LLDRLSRLQNEIIEFQPEKSFIHITPSSVEPIVLFNSLKGVERYQVNLTDHAFWLGLSSIDYSIEFRNYGYTVSTEKRGLKKEQCLLQSFYPITDCKPFKGLPKVVKEDSIVVFTGGAYYKMYGENDMFFKLIKSIVNVNKNVVVLIAGGGNPTPLENFISENKLSERVVLIGSRSDINFIFKSCDIYLSTFPFTGGLMGQFAAVNKKPVLSFSPKNIPFNFTEGFLNWKKRNWKVTHHFEDDFLIEAEKMINNSEYRDQKGDEAFENLIKFNEFNDHLKELITFNRNIEPLEHVTIDYNKFTNLYIDCENNYQPWFYSYILSRFKLRTIILFPDIFIKIIFSKNTRSKMISALLRKIK